MLTLFSELLRRTLPVGCAVAVLTQLASAQVLVQWVGDAFIDPENGETGLGGDGTWSAVSTNWLNPQTDPPELITWTEAEALDLANAPSAEFGGDGVAPSTVTVANDASNPQDQLTFHTMRFVSNGYSIEPADAASGLTADGTLRIAAAEGVDASILTSLSGTGGVTINPEPTDTGRVILLGDNSYHGDTEVVNGALRISEQEAAALSEYVIQSGASLEVSGSVVIDEPVTLHGGALLAAVEGSGIVSDVRAAATNTASDPLNFHTVNRTDIPVINTLTVNTLLTENDSIVPLQGTINVTGDGLTIFETPLEGLLNVQTGEQGGAVLNASGNQLSEIRLDGSETGFASIGVARDDATTSADIITIAPGTQASVFGETINQGDSSNTPRTINANILFDDDDEANASSLRLGNNANTRDLILTGDINLQNQGFQRQISIGRLNGATAAELQGFVDSESGFVLTGGALNLNPQNGPNFIQGLITLEDNATLQLQQNTDLSLGGGGTEIELVGASSSLIIGDSLPTDIDGNILLDQFTDQAQVTAELTGFTGQAITIGNAVNLPTLNLGQGNVFIVDGGNQPANFDFTGRIIDQIGELFDDPTVDAVARAEYVTQLKGSSVVIRTGDSDEDFVLRNSVTTTEEGFNSYHGFLMLEGTGSPTLLSNSTALPSPHPNPQNGIEFYDPITLLDGSVITPQSGAIYSNLAPGGEPLTVTLDQSELSDVAFNGQFLGGDIDLVIAGTTPFDGLTPLPNQLTFNNYNELNSITLESGVLLVAPQNLVGDLAVESDAFIHFEMNSADPVIYNQTVTLESSSNFIVDTRLSASQNGVQGTLLWELPADGSGISIDRANILVENARLGIQANAQGIMDASTATINIRSDGELHADSLTTFQITNEGLFSPGRIDGTGDERFATVRTGQFTNLQNFEDGVAVNDPTIRLQFGANGIQRDQLIIVGVNGENRSLTLGESGGSLDLEFLDVTPGSQTPLGTLNADGTFTPAATADSGTQFQLIDTELVLGNFNEFSTILRNPAGEALDVEIEQHLVLLFPQDIAADGFPVELLPDQANTDGVVLFVKPETLVTRVNDPQQQQFLGAFDIVIDENLGDDRRLTVPLFAIMLLTPQADYAELANTLELDVIPAVSPREGFERIAFEQSDLLARRLSLFMEQARAAKTRKRWEKYAFFGWAEGSTADFDFGDYSGDYQTGGVTVGFDWSRRPDFYAGAFVQYEDANLELVRSEIEARTVRGGFFFTRKWEKSYVEFIYARGNISYDYLRRSPSFGNVRADPTGKQYLLSFSAGRQIELGDWIKMRPHVGFSISELEIGDMGEAYDRAAGIDLSLFYPETNSTSQKSRVGVDFVKDLPSRRLRTRALLRLVWEHEFSNDRPNQLAYLARNPSAPFQVLTNDVSANSWIIDAQVQTFLAPFTTMYIGYGGEFSEQTTQLNINTGGRMAF